MARYPLSLQLQVPVDFTDEDVVVGPKCFQRSVKWRQNLVAAGQRFNKFECGARITFDDGLVYRQGTAVATFTSSARSTELGPDGVEFLEWLRLHHPSLVVENLLENSPATLNGESTIESEKLSTIPQKPTSAEGLLDAPSDFDVSVPESVVSTHGTAYGLGHNDAAERESDEDCEPSAAGECASISELTYCNPDPPLPEVNVEQPPFLLELAEPVEMEISEFLVENSENGYIFELAGRLFCVVMEECNASVISWLDRPLEQSQSDGTAVLVAKLVE